MQNEIIDLAIEANDRLIQIKESELKMLYKKIRDYEVLLVKQRFELDCVLYNRQETTSE